MLSQSFSRKTLLVRSLLLIPVLGLCILFFNQDIVAQAIESEHTTLVGQWVDQNTETAFIDIYEENNTLWADLKNEKFSLQNDSKGYYIEDKNFNRGEKFYLSTDTSGNLKFGDREVLLIPSSKSIKKSIQGAWYNSSTGSTYIFSTENGITCDVLKEGEKPVRYWPILKDGGVSFTMGYDWVSFKREGQDLVFFDTHKQTYRLQRSAEYSTLNQTDETPSELINTTTQNPQSYTTQFIEGAKRNGKKPIVIELRNNKIYVNGTYTSIENLRATVDAATVNWSKQYYKDPVRSFLFKGNSVDFIERAETEFQKTILAQINGNIQLAPPLPPAPAATRDVPSLLISPEAHFKKMKNLNGLFFYEGTPVSYETAIHLAQANKNLNVKTPYPYSNPPETHLSKSPINEIPQQTNRNKNGDTLVITLVDTGQKALAVMNNATQGTIIDQPAKDPGVDRTALDTYNRLAKKYTVHPNGEIKREEIKTMSAIYKLMNVEQKEKATPYPTIPPPPPKQKESKGKKIGDVNTSAKRQSKTLYANSWKTFNSSSQQLASNNKPLKTSKILNTSLSDFYKKTPNHTKNEYQGPIMIKNHIKKGGKFRYNDTLISKEEALFIVQQQPTSFLKNANKPEELILIPNPMTDNIDFYFNDKIITKKEALQYSLDRAYRAVPKTVDNHRKPSYDFVKRL